jgi:hypothetical protein
VREAFVPVMTMQYAGVEVENSQIFFCWFEVIVEISSSFLVCACADRFAIRKVI